jgi:hypothetical protein
MTKKSKTLKQKISKLKIKVKKSLNKFNKVASIVGKCHDKQCGHIITIKDMEEQEKQINNLYKECPTISKKKWQTGKINASILKCWHKKEIGKKNEQFTDILVKREKCLEHKCKKEDDNYFKQRELHLKYVDNLSKAKAKLKKSSKKKRKTSKKYKSKKK